MKYKPHNYQIHAGKHIRRNKKCALFLDMGLGKTVVTLTELEWMYYQDLSAEKILVIGPKNVILSVWRQEAEKWDHLKHLRFSTIWGTKEERLKALRADADIYLINRENVVWLQQTCQSAWPFNVVVVDELSSFKNHRSQRFKALNLVKKYIERMIGLTGTPSPNGFMDLWSQIYLLDNGERLEKTISGYRERYFVAQSLGIGYVAKYVLRPEAKDNITNKIKDICISMKAKDYLELPPVTVNDVVIELDKKTYEQYKKFEEEQIMQILDKEITALNAASLTNKLLQFANGAIYHTKESREYVSVHNEKLERLEELIDEAQGKPVLVFYGFQSDLDRIQKRFPKARLLKGPKEIEEWNQGKIEIMLAHPASAGHGLNLQAGGHIMIWYGQTWSLELYLQAIARLVRQGQTNRVIINRLVVKGTMDMRVIKALANKEREQDSLMEAVKAIVEDYKKAHRR